MFKQLSDELLMPAGSGTRPTPFQLCTLSPRAVSRLRQCVRSSQIVAATGFCHITEGRSRTSSRDPSNGILLQSGFNRLAAALAAAADAAEAIATERTADAGSGASDESSAYQALHGVLAAVAADVKAVKDAIMDRAADGRQRKMQLQRQRRHQQRHPESPQPGARRQAMQMTRQQKRPDTAHLENNAACAGCTTAVPTQFRVAAASRFSAVQADGDNTAEMECS